MQNNSHDSNSFVRKMFPMPVKKKDKLPDVRPCKQCQVPKEEKEFRKGGRTCRTCEAEKNRTKRAERWEYLGLDMSTKF